MLPPKRRGGGKPGASRSSRGLKVKIADFKHDAEANARENEMLYELADADMDWHLDFEEFKDLVSSRLGFEEPKDAAEAKARDSKMRNWYAGPQTLFAF